MLKCLQLFSVANKRRAFKGLGILFLCSIFVSSPVLAQQNYGDLLVGGMEENSVNTTFDASQITISSAPDYSITYSGNVQSQGDTRIKADQTRSTFGVSGSGIKIGIISDSFNNGNDPATAPGVSEGELPGPGNPTNSIPVSVLNDAVASDEGRAMAELIHDVAPGAELFFHSAFNNNNQGTPGGTIATAIDNLVAAGVDIIVDDVGVLTEPVFQDGAAAQAVNNAKNSGIAYFSAAGNSANKSYQATFNPSSGDSNVHNFDADGDDGPGGDTVLNVSLPGGTSTRFVLHWEDAYRSVSGNNATVDFSLALADNAGNILGEVDQNQLSGGADPFEFISINNSGATTTDFGLKIITKGGDPTGKLLKITAFDGGDIADEDDTNSNTVNPHAAAEGGLAVAAARHSQNSIESFSSHGPSLILFDEDGNPIPGGEVRNKPDITGPDGTSTSVSGFSSFFGTSAAAPHVAAAAALVMERANSLGFSLSVDDVYNLLLTTADPVSGEDGAGMVNTFAAVEALNVQADAVPEPMNLALVAVGFLVLLRRKSVRS